MITSEQQRNMRLKSDYKEMENIRCAAISWKPISGDPPLVLEYEITVNIKTIISSDLHYRDKHVVRLKVPDGYPMTPPTIWMISDPPPFHPNWWSDPPASRGKWCSGSDWIPSEGLGEFVIRMIRTLQFDKNITNENSAANHEANRWYLARKNTDLFPFDRTRLPDPNVEAAKKKTFVIRGPVTRTTP